MHIGRTEDGLVPVILNDEESAGMYLEVQVRALVFIEKVYPQATIRRVSDEPDRIWFSVRSKVSA